MLVRPLTHLYISDLTLFFVLAFCVRYQLNGKKNKVDNYSRKPNSYPAQHLMACLSNVSNNEDFKDDSCVSPLSKSLVGGSMNICKTRILNFVEQVQGALYHIY